MKRIAPGAEKAQGIVDLLSGTDEQVGGGELLSRMVRLCSERVIQQPLEEDQARFSGKRPLRAIGALLGPSQRV